MHLLLPPSETKRSGGGSVFSAAGLTHADALGEARALVRDALVEMSGDEQLAHRVLKLGVKNRDERLRNLRLETSGAMPAIDRYTGVLYDALGAATLSAPARRWVGRNVSIQSALFGLVAAGDGIPAYRLSASTRPPALGVTLKQLWSEAHSRLEWATLGWILDLRSKDYAALAPLPPGAGATLNVVQRGPQGEMRALNHFNKAAKGDLVRRLAEARPRITGAAAFLRWAQQAGLEVCAGPSATEITLVTELGAGAPTVNEDRARLNG